MVSRKRLKLTAICAVLLVLLFGAYLGGGAIHDANTRSLRSAVDSATSRSLRDAATGKSLRAAVYGQCHRQNVGRVTGNRNNYAQYKLWGAALTLFQYGESQPGAGQSDPHAALLLSALLSAMTVQLHTESWTPLSDCHAATDHPVSYVPPAAVPFFQHQPPPSAFTVGPGE